MRQLEQQQQGEPEQNKKRSEDQDPREETEEESDSEDQDPRGEKRKKRKGRSACKQDLPGRLPDSDIEEEDAKENSDLDGDVSGLSSFETVSFGDQDEFVD